MGQGRHVLGNVTDMEVHCPSSRPAGTRSFAEAHPAEVQALVTSFTRAIAIEVHHPSQTEAVTVKYAHITDPTPLLRTCPSTAPHLNRVPRPLAGAAAEGLRLMAPRATAARTANPASMADTRFVQSLESSGFRKTLYPGGTGGAGGSVAQTAAGGSQGQAGS